MSYALRLSLEEGAITQVSEFARLPLAEDRRDLVARTLDGVLSLTDMLDSVDVGETPPATAFDARWE